MVLAYIRPDKNFDTAHEQLQRINSYALSNNIFIDDEFIDYTSQNKRLSQRKSVTDYFQNTKGDTLLVYDVWVLSSDMEDVIQMFSCLLKHEFNVHFIKPSVIMSQQSSAMLVLGLMDQLRQTLQSESKKLIGRPIGSKSSSKFDKHFNEIIAFIKESKNVSEMARELHVSRSSLKDYIESRELKQVAFGSLLPKVPENAEAQVIDKITCPN
jgi:DNA invertase Pin-like site-specific DNA recombinase